MTHGLYLCVLPSRMRTKSEPFPVAVLYERFAYDPLRGLLVSKATGKPLSCRQRDRNTYAGVSYGSRPNKKSYSTTYGRLVMAWLTGEWPSVDVDHIDRNTSNNTAWNLRLVSRRINTQNRRTFNGGTSKVGKRWRSRIRVKREVRHLGYFDTELEAQEAYKKACENLP